MAVKPSKHSPVGYMLRRWELFARCGYEDANDYDDLRADPLFIKLAVGRAPESGRDLCSQPTMSALENASSQVEVARMTAALVDIFRRSLAAGTATMLPSGLQQRSDDGHRPVSDASRRFSACRPRNCRKVPSRCLPR